jgi:hypothetical protein
VSYSVEHELQLRAAARAIYDACYPSEEWAMLNFDEAERCGTLQYGQAVGAAQMARLALRDQTLQPGLFFGGKLAPELLRHGYR